MCCHLSALMVNGGFEPFVFLTYVDAFDFICAKYSITEIRELVSREEAIQLTSEDEVIHFERECDMENESLTFTSD